ncbi:MAG: nicotinate-nucleotide adenylyltransferase [Actinobacteria bacterium]|nr:nicotinate-nucleotide adenylyltransferase [Actinomycetota bacterium]MCZ6739030.1 nicotinate-nucleotide adenylyltransferase [Actinomycetota bacterium]
MRTGILGGTFDPIHIAHLHAGETALHQAELDRVLFIPAGDPWQKLGRRVSATEHRLEMVRLATVGVDGFHADDREATRDGLTYTVDTLATFPDSEELFLILGADAAFRVPTWERHREVLDRATVLVVPRSGTDSLAVANILPDAVFLDMAVLEVSGTEIRAMARNGNPFRFLVSDEVHTYISENNLYAEAGIADMVEGPTDMEEPS